MPASFYAGDSPTLAGRYYVGSELHTFAAPHFSRRSGDVGSVVEERKVAATPEAVALGMICSREVLLAMKRKLLELQKA